MDNLVRSGGSAAGDEPIRPVAEQWAVDACVKITAIRNLKDVALAGPSRRDPEKREAVAKAIEKFLATAEMAIDPKRRFLGVRGPVDRWRGTSVVVAYQSLHAAEVFLVDLLPDEQVQVLVPTVEARARAALDPADPRWLAVDQLPAVVAERRPGYRTAVQQAMRIGYDTADRAHVQVRNFRNMLLASAFVLLFLMGALAWLVAANPDAMPLCFTPNTGTAAAETIQTVCPSGDHKQPTGGDVLIVAGLGLLGGALAAAFSIRNARGASTPYDVPVALAFFKLPLGALTAVTSILLLGGSFVPGLSELDSQRQILAYALVFGYAQQLISRLIDNRAQTVLSALPSRDPDDRRTSAPAPPAPPVAPAPPTSTLEPPVAPARLDGIAPPARLPSVRATHERRIRRVTPHDGSP
jgi:hypothetical protein